MRIYFLLAGIAALLVAGCGAPKPTDSEQTRNPAAPALDKDAVVIDVRTPEEYSRAHIKGAINIPVDTIESRIAEAVPDKTTPLIVHCQSGRRSKMATGILESKGYQVQDLGSFANAKSILDSRK